MSSLSTIDTASDLLGNAIDRGALLDSLSQQRQALAESIVLTPVDSLPLCLPDRSHTAFLHGLYLTDKERDAQGQRDAPILFGGREQAVRDLTAINRLLADSFGAAKGSLRLLSGLHAHIATFMSIATIGDTVLLLSEEAGGHFNTHTILHRLGLRTLDLPVDRQRLCIDQGAALDLVRREQPDFIFIDRSEGLRYEDFAFIGELEGPAKIFDSSHYVPQIITGHYPNPLTWGFDLMLFSLHKSFPGPQKAGVVGREDDELWASLISGLSGLVSNSHPEDSYLVGLTLLRKEWLATYVDRLLDTACELEDRLLRRGLDVLPSSAQGNRDWPNTHHVWLNAPSKAVAFHQFRALANSHLHTNYRKLPYGLGYGHRLGTSFSAVSGLDVDHVPELAEIIAAALDGGETHELRERVRELAADARKGALVAPEFWA